MYNVEEKNIFNNKTFIFMFYLSGYHEIKMFLCLYIV